LKALLNEEWGRVENAEPKLSVVCADCHKVPCTRMPRPSRDAMLAWRGDTLNARRHTIPR